MPANKNAVIRYKYLDELLSDSHHYYDIHDLVDKVNDKLELDGFLPVSQRTVEGDLTFMSYAPFSAPIVHERRGGRAIIRYKQRGYSIFTKELSDDEAAMLAEVLNTLGQFEGLESFTWLDDLQQKLGVRKQRTVISFQQSASMQTAMLGRLFIAISNNQVVRLSYHTFKDGQQKLVVVHPYLLKQYNNRWFLICSADSDGFMLTFALDRIDDFEECPEIKFKPCNSDIMKRFEDIVGVTLPKDGKIENIVVWVSDSGCPYITSKPIHPTQYLLDESEESEWRKANPHLTGGRYILIRCIVNTELIQQIMSYTDELVVVAPNSLKKTIKQKILQQTANYFPERK